MTRGDVYASSFGALYSAYMERPRLSRSISRVVGGLHCFDDPRGALAEAARILRPGGRLVGSSFLRGTDSLRQRFLIRPGAGDFGRVATQGELEAWLRENGFELSTQRRAGPMWYFDARLLGATK